MTILLECFISIESAPVFTLGMAKALVGKGNDIYAILPAEIENKNEWVKILSEAHIFFIDKMWRIEKYHLYYWLVAIQIGCFFRGIEFDYCIDTFPWEYDKKICKLVSCESYLGIDHDVIPHSSTDVKAASKVLNALKDKDGIIVLSKQFINDAKLKYSGLNIKIMHMRHGIMEYPSINIDQSDLSSNVINFLYFGRIDGYKGLHVLANAYKELEMKYDNVFLTVAGRGDFSDYKEEYEKLNKCEILNKYIDNSDISKLFSKPNTVLVLPYIDATQSGVIGMAYFYRIPVIVSDIGGLKEQMFDGEAGVYTIAGDWRDLLKKMELFIIDNEIYNKQVSFMNKGYYKSTWEYVVDELLNQL